ncbi:MAG: exosortase/archaeosortase family protein [Planctomycetaceae bacterium]
MPWIIIGVLGAALIYSYWVSLEQLPSFWDNPQYQHGWIVPVFTTMLLFWWRKPVGPITPSARAAGIGLLAASFALRLFCASYRIVTIDMYTFVPALMGVFLLAGGWSVFRWAWAPLASLIFMYPLPDEATRYLLGPLQTVATILSTYGLQTLGLDAFRDGNRINLADGQVLGVVDACSGLKMLTIFVWLAAMLMLVGGLEWWENLVIAASAIPIALMCNAFRIVTVGVMYNYKMSMAEHFHDSTPAAMLMMLLAVGFLVLEMKILSYLVVMDDLAPTALAGGGSAGLSGRGGPGVATPAGARQAVRPVVAPLQVPSTAAQRPSASGFPAIPRGTVPAKKAEPQPPDSDQIVG